MSILDVKYLFSTFLTDVLHFFFLKIKLGKDRFLKGGYFLLGEGRNIISSLLWEALVDFIKM